MLCHESLEFILECYVLMFTILIDNIKFQNDTVINMTFRAAPPVLAYDQDFGINASLEYVLIEGKVFRFNQHSHV